MAARKRWLLSCLPTVFGAITLLTLLGGTEAPPAASLSVDASGAIAVAVRGLRNDDGHVLFVLFADEQAFPSEDGRAIRKAKETVTRGMSRATWKSVPHGTYAIAVVHDEIDNAELDTNFLGIPKEGIGASNNATGRMGPPKWKDAKFEHAGDASAQLIKIIYL